MLLKICAMHLKKKKIKDSFSDEWSNIKVLTKIKENKNNN